MVAVENKLIRRQGQATCRSAAAASANRLGEEAAGKSGGNKPVAVPINLVPINLVGDLLHLGWCCGPDLGGLVAWPAGTLSLLVC